MDVHIETPINAPAERVWGILAHDFANVAHWAAGVKWSEAATADEAPADFDLAPTAPIPGRTTDAGLVLKEFFTAFDDDGMQFTFRAAGLPRIIRLSQNTSTVVPTGAETSTVVFDIHMELVGPFALLAPVLKRRLAKGLAPVQHDLKVYAETGQPSATDARSAA